MREYTLYVLKCQSVDVAPMPKQAWFQLGMPDSPENTSHMQWECQDKNTSEYIERAALFKRIKKTPQSKY